MQFFKIFISFILLSVLISCDQKPNEIELKNEIKTWWKAEEINEVIINDIAKEKNSLTVLAQIVVIQDTLDRMTYEFEKFSKGWRITKGPVDELTKVLFIETFWKAKIGRLKLNMHTLQLSLENFSTMAEGFYPADFTVKIKDIIAQLYKDIEYYSGGDETILNLLPENYTPEPIKALGDTSQWFPEYKGKVIYFPMGIKGKGANSYIIKGSTDKAFIDFYLRS